LPVAIAAIQREIPINNTQFSHLQVAFLLAYAVMYAGGGKLIDVLGTRRGFLWIMLFWSLACASHGLAAGFGMLAVSRFLLGMGEGGGFPAATKAVSEWFPARERSTAMGVINAGTAVGAVIAPPTLAAVIQNLGWRWVFFLCGAAGLLWSVWWLREYFAPAQHPRLTERERNEIEEVGAAPAQQKYEIAWLNLFAFPQVWGLVLGKFLSDAAWYFYLFWLPKYLYDARGFDTKQVGYYAWIPYAAAGVGSLLGGWFSSQLLRRGNSLNLSRKVALGASAAVMPLIIFITQVPVDWAIALFSVAFFGQQSWSTLVMILPADLFPRRVVGSVAGLVGFGGAMGGVVFNLVAGRMLDAGFGYGPVFAIVSALHVLAFILILFTIREVRPLEVKGVLV
jgi:ACS family hexuronate transporter-like MFS transporter